jgi:soluble lytic murein transglycosylase-like protein
MRGGRPITSRAGAMGLMQLMPATWQAMRRRVRSRGQDPFDPHDNILAGSLYLRSMFDRFGHPGLFAAYNAGPSRYAAYLAGQQTLPGETRRYLAAVTAGAAPVPAIRRNAATLFAIAGPAPAGAAASATGLFVIRRR